MPNWLPESIGIKDLYALPPTEEPPIFSVAYPASAMPKERANPELLSSKERPQAPGNNELFEAMYQVYIKDVLPNSGGFQDLKPNMTKLEDEVT